MSQFIQTSYPLLAESRGPVKEYLKEIDIKSESGIYLDFVFASTYKRFKRVVLNFNISLAPESISVEMQDGIEIKSWRISELSTAEFDEIINFAKELDLSFDSEMQKEELIRAILLHVNKEKPVMVTAYRQA